MDLQFWLYVIIGVIYLISRLVKKQENQSDLPDNDPVKPVRPEKGSQTGSDKNVPRQLTFEELLREITEAKTGTAPESKPLPAPAKPAYSYEELLEDEVTVEEGKHDLEDENYDYRKDDEVVKAYEEAKRQAFLRPSLEETMDVMNTEVKYARFKEFEQEKQRNLIQDYLVRFNDPEGWKKAIVMSEILTRKF